MDSIERVKYWPVKRTHPRENFCQINSFNCNLTLTCLHFSVTAKWACPAYLDRDDIQLWPAVHESWIKNTKSSYAYKKWDCIQWWKETFPIYHEWIPAWGNRNSASKVELPWASSRSRCVVHIWCWKSAARDIVHSKFHWRPLRVWQRNKAIMEKAYMEWRTDRKYLIKIISWLCFTWFVRV